jgi:type II secretion system protein I
MIRTGPGTNRPGRLPAGRATRRAGLTLLEVLIALAIFLFSLVAIGRLVSLGSERAADVQLQSIAAMKCQSIMSEVISGSIQLAPQSDQAFAEDPSWRWSMDCSQENVPNLWKVQVKVRRDATENGPGMEISLFQFVLDPSVRGSTQDVAASVATSTSKTKTSGGGTSGGQATRRTPAAGATGSNQAAPANNTKTGSR